MSYDIEHFNNVLKQHRLLRRFASWRRNIVSLRYGLGFIRAALKKDATAQWRHWNGAYVPLESGHYFYIPRELELHGYTVLTRGVEDNYVATLLVRFCEPGAVVVDVGANIGEMTFHFARSVGSQGRVFAFEPIPFLADAVARTAAINGMTQVTVANAAVSSQAGTLHIEAEYDKNNIVDSGGSRVTVEATNKSVPVATVVLDDWLLPQLGEDESISLLKIDVEGHELPVLLGAQRLLAAHGPALAIEIGHESEDARHQMAALLTPLGYVPTAAIFRVGLLPLTWDNFVALSGPLKAGGSYDILLLKPRPESGLVTSF